MHDGRSEIGFEAFWYAISSVRRVSYWVAVDIESRYEAKEGWWKRDGGREKANAKSEQASSLLELAFALQTQIGLEISLAKAR